MQRCLASSLLVCALVVLVTRTVDGCSCMKSHEQDLFCRADAVIQGTIKNKRFIYADSALTNNEIFSSSFSDLPMPVVAEYRYPLYVVYNVTIDAIYKGEEIVGMTTISISSAGDGAMCGVPGLEEGQTYIISGYVWDGEINIGLCGSWIQTVGSLSSMQKRGLKRLYAKTCGNCKVCSYMDRDCTPSNSCKDDPFNSCFLKHSVCQQSSRRTCAWKSSKYAKLC